MNLSESSFEMFDVNFSIVVILTYFVSYSYVERVVLIVLYMFDMNIQEVILNYL